MKAFSTLCVLGAAIAVALVVVARTAWPFGIGAEVWRHRGLGYRAVIIERSAYHDWGDGTHPTPAIKIRYEDGSEGWVEEKGFDQSWRRD